MDQYLRVLERQAQASNNWERYAHALSRIINRVNPDNTALWVVTILHGKNILTTLFGTEIEAKVYILSRVYEKAISFSIPEDLDEERLETYQNFTKLIEANEYDDAWELYNDEFSGYLDFLAEHIAESYTVEQHEIQLSYG